MAEYEPLPGRNFVSQAVVDWLRSKTESGVTRLVLFLNVVSIVKRPTELKQSIVDGYLVNCKLHDKEPELIVHALQEKTSDFFHGMPNRGTIAMTSKKAMVGQIMQSYINLGLPKYGKPGLRNDNDLIQEI